MVESEDVKKAEIDRLYKENVSKVYRTALYYVEGRDCAGSFPEIIRQPGRYMYGVRACMADHYRKEYGKELSKR